MGSLGRSDVNVLPLLENIFLANTKKETVMERLSKSWIKSPPWIAIAVILYCAWVSRSIVVVWETSPLDRFSWIPLLIWLFPLKNMTETLSPGQIRGLTIGLAISFFGVIASVNTIKLAGLAVSLASLTPWNRRTLIWVCCAISWIPTLGWILVHFFPGAGELIMLLIRIVIASFGVGFVWRKT